MRILPGTLPREQRRVWFADGILPNGETTESSKGPPANPNPSQPVATSQSSNKSSGANASEVTIYFAPFEFISNMEVFFRHRLISIMVLILRQSCYVTVMNLCLFRCCRRPVPLEPRPPALWAALSVWSQRTDFLPSSSPQASKEVREATSQVLAHPHHSAASTLLNMSIGACLCLSVCMYICFCFCLHHSC